MSGEERFNLRHVRLIHRQRLVLPRQAVVRVILLRDGLRRRQSPSRPDVRRRLVDGLRLLQHRRVLVALEDEQVRGGGVLSRRRCQTRLASALGGLHREERVRSASERVEVKGLAEGGGRVARSRDLCRRA